MKTTKKGDKFVCIKKVVMKDSTIAYNKGFIYTSEVNHCITNNTHDVNHGWREQNKLFKKYFIKIKN